MRLPSWITEDSFKDLFKEARKKALWALLVLAGGYFLAFLRGYFQLERTPTWPEVPSLFFSALRSYLDLLGEPFEWAFAHPVFASVILSFSIFTVVLLILLQRLRSGLKDQRKLVEDLSKYEALAVLSGLKEWWPHAAKDNTGAPWDVLRADIERPENNIIHLLGANGLDTFGAADAPLHETLKKFRAGSIRAGPGNLHRMISGISA